MARVCSRVTGSIFRGWGASPWGSCPAIGASVGGLFAVPGVRGGDVGRYHADVDNAFRGWNDAWLDPGFADWNITEELAYIRVPILIVQGEADQYGTVAQIEVAREECYCPVEVVLLPGVRHQPHREGAEATLTFVADFARRILQEQESSAAAAV